MEAVCWLSEAMHWIMPATLWSQVLHTCIQCKLQPYHANITVTCGTCIFLIVQGTYVGTCMYINFILRVYANSYTSLQYKKSGFGGGMHINQMGLKNLRIQHQMLSL